MGESWKYRTAETIYITDARGPPGKHGLRTPNMIIQYIRIQVEYHSFAGMYQNHIHIPQKATENTDPRPTLVRLVEPRHDHSDPDISNGDKIIAVQVGKWHPKSYGESMHG